MQLRQSTRKCARREGCGFHQEMLRCFHHSFKEIDDWRKVGEPADEPAPAPVPGPSWMTPATAILDGVPLDSNLDGVPPPHGENQ